MNLLTAILFTSLVSATQYFSCNKQKQPTPAGCEVALGTGLIAYYPFNGDAKDYSGNNKHGELKNGTRFSTNAANRTNSAAYFDGIDDWINIPDNNNYFSRDKMSISFLINLRDASKRSNIINKAAFNQAASVCWGAFITQRLSFRVVDPQVACGEIWHDNNQFDLEAKRKIRDGEWYHVTLIFNEGVEMIYINGSLESAIVNNFKKLKGCSDADLRIAGWWKDDIISFHGKMDELRIYDRILAETEINELAKQKN